MRTERQGLVILYVKAPRDGQANGFVSDAYLVATSYFFPTPLQIVWGPWKNALNAVGKN